VFTWTFDTTITISRLVFNGLFDRHPSLKLIAHHGAGMIPHFSGRIAMLSRFTDMDWKLGDDPAQLRRPPIEYFKMVYADTAMFGGAHGCRCVLESFGVDHVLFGSNAPFDSEGGRVFIPATISDVEIAAPDPAVRSAVFEGNARRLFGV
jgi:predicted TIM-barrel fold metal-dependent hydrolase